MATRKTNHIFTILILGFSIFTVRSIIWLFDGEATAQTAPAPEPLLVAVNTDGDSLRLTYRPDASAIDTRTETLDGAMTDDSWTYSSQAHANSIMISVCGRYAAVVVLAGDALHSHTFKLSSSFWCDEYKVWLPVVQ